MDVEEVIDALYALPPARFVGARDEAAAGAGREGDPAARKRIAQLRRPTLAAWTSNTLVRAMPQEVEQFRRLGQALRKAHRSLDGDRLRALSHQQHVVIGALAREAQRLAGEAGTPVSETVLREVEQILHAALADPEAADAWASGRLAKAPALPTDLPGIDPGAVPPAAAATGRRAAAPRAAERRPDPRVDAARTAVQNAQRAVAAREDELRLAEEAHQRAVERAATADAEADRAQAARDRAHHAVAQARQQRRAADDAAAGARRAAQSATRRLRTLDGALDGATPQAEGGPADPPSADAPTAPEDT
ncbi:hypothetical protein [Streptomyces sp. CB00455]|uniref:hypothetical protein n=1 Tax=Streptomyces sp. CB00455 TaxID=1703927 RepID=UPI0011613609|nr:hypothetical protein [Streptomyces sp. CB00455]